MSRFGGGGGGGGRGFGDRGGGGGMKNKQPGGNLRKPRWDEYTLVPFEKHFYNPHPNLLNADPREVRFGHFITVHPFSRSCFPDGIINGLKIYVKNFVQVAWLSFLTII